ncbi:hypothetical protein DPSP01_002820 [Paraphaeosphaeria sporulosa]
MSHAGPTAGDLTKCPTCPPRYREENMGACKYNRLLHTITSSMDTLVQRYCHKLLDRIDLASRPASRTNSLFASTPHTLFAGPQPHHIQLFDASATGDLPAQVSLSSLVQL